MNKAELRLVVGSGPWLRARGVETAGQVGVFGGQSTEVGVGFAASA